MSQQIREQLQATLGSAYTLERELGGGGMSRVFVAEETALRRRVAIKLLSPELAQGISVDRFEREILTAAALQQANIVPLLTSGQSNGLPYYTMPFVEGESLRARLGRGPMDITEVIGVLRDVAKALAYAHQRGVVHRDIKPDNVLISGGTAVVTDFGIAKALSAARTGTADATLTQIGTSIGTPAYMAPEQAAGDPDIDRRADIYSLGAMAYELLTGQPVFADRTAQRMLAAHMSEAPPEVTALRPDTPPQLAQLVMQCLAKAADDRPQQAGDIAHVLDTITSAGGMQAMPQVLLGGPGMFRKAIALYAAAFVVVALLAKAAIVGIGLPDWVFPGSLIVMALGLPVVLWTGYVYRVARRAATATPTFTPGGTPSMVRGTIATMALKAAPRMSWYRTAQGGVYALGTFVVLIAVAMLMRVAGIGPFKTLIASGDLTGRDKLIVADFAVSNADASLGRVVGDAIRAGLSDSRVFTMMSPSEIGGALRRMQLPQTSAVPLPVAQQIALREQAKAVVDGDVTKVESSYIVVVRLLTAEAGRELMSFRGTASSADGIIDVADDLSRKLRAKAGESLRRVQATPRLAYASTSSLDALRKYSEAARANDVERDYQRAVTLLREAVALDSNFAEGWRKLAVAIRNAGRYAPAVSDSAIRRAFALSDRMTERERDAVLGYYYSGSPGFDREKAAVAYRRMLARGDSIVALQNLGVIYGQRREYAKAESLYRAGIRLEPANMSSYNNLSGTLATAGRMRERDSVLAVMAQRFPGQVTLGRRRIDALGEDGRFDEAVAALDSARRKGDPQDPAWAHYSIAYIAEVRGRLREAAAARFQARALDSTSGRGYPRHFASGAVLDAQVDAGLPFEAELKAYEDDVGRIDYEHGPLVNWPATGIARTLARAGQVDRARQLLARYETALARDTALLRWRTPEIQSGRAEIALVERKWSEAASLFRKADRREDGPLGSCDECVPRDLMRTFAQAGMADSAIAVYEAYRQSPWGGRERQGPDPSLDGALTEALARIYDAKGDTARAAELYRDVIAMWKDADPELQPRVQAARARLRVLEPVEGRRP